MNVRKELDGMVLFTGPFNDGVYPERLNALAGGCIGP